jgi:hypothetical protein
MDIFSLEKFLNEYVVSTDVTIMPIIGIVTTVAMCWGDIILPSESYGVVKVFQEKDHTYYVTNKWYKENSVPLVLVDTIVEKFEKKR